MTLTSLIPGVEKFELQIYQKPDEFQRLIQSHIAFTGAPKKHPSDPKKVILVIDPYSTNTFYYEFETDTIAYVEERPNLVNQEGETVTMARIWVRKGAVALRCSPFVVQDVRYTG